MNSQAEEENLDDSLDFNYGSQKVDANSFNGFLENEKANFRLLIAKVFLKKVPELNILYNFFQVTELGGVPILIKAGDMSNTIPDEKVTATFVGYLAARLLDLSREIKAARIIQVEIMIPDCKLLISFLSSLPGGRLLLLGGKRD